MSTQPLCYPVNFNSRSSVLVKEPKKEIDFLVIGQQGCRGLMPGNTIGAFMHALKTGVNAIEMDVMMSADGELVLTDHNVISPLNYYHPSIKEELNVFELTLEELKQFDCGKRFNKLFPFRRMISSTIPLLKNVVSRIEKYILWNNGKSIQYFFDIKTSPDTDGMFHPKPEEIIIRLTDIIRTQNIARRCTILSSDVRPLQQIKRLSQKVNIALKVENPESVNDNITALGFKPDIYMLPYKDVNYTLVYEVHSLGMKLMPYGANDILDMNEMININADGLLTDFPDHALKLLNVSEKSIPSVSHF